MVYSYLNRFLNLSNRKPAQGERLISRNQTNMEYTTLGRTGLKLSVMGLGSGGHSRLGQGTGKSKRESITIVRSALDFGINFIDTAEVYNTEKLVGEAIRHIKREDIVLSTKKSKSHKGTSISTKELVKGLEQSLRHLRTDYVDIYHLHGVSADEYEYALTELVPVLLKMRDQGKVRFIGITEAFVSDTQHKMLERAVQDNCWDVVMTGFNMLNQSARERVFAKTIQNNIGVLGAFAVRRALSNPKRLREAILELKKRELVDPELFDEEEPLGFLFHDGGAISITDAAYRYCRYEPGIHVVLFGTGSLDHLEANVTSLLRPPLPDSDLLRLKKIFAKVDEFSGN